MRSPLLLAALLLTTACGASSPDPTAGTEEVAKTGKGKKGKGKGGKRKAGKRKATTAEGATTAPAADCPAAAELKDVLSASALKDTVPWTGLGAVVQCEGPYAAARTVPPEGGAASTAVFVKKDGAWQALSVGSCAEQVPADVAQKLGC